MSEQVQHTKQFRSLHAKGQVIVLPNAWDAASARVAEDCGAKAIATSSASLAWAHGYADGEHIPMEALFATVREILRVVRVPVSVDCEAGFSDDPEAVAALVGRLIDLGAVGMNIEDADKPAELLVRKIEAIRRTVSARHADFFINARADVYLLNLAEGEKALRETIARGKAYCGAGADGFFVPSLFDLSALKDVVETIDLPLNVVTIAKGVPPLAELKRAGVRRISAGSATAKAAFGALRRTTLAMLDGRFEPLFEEAQGCPNMNALMTR